MFKTVSGFRIVTHQRSIIKRTFRICAVVWSVLLLMLLLTAFNTGALSKREMPRIPVYGTIPTTGSSLDVSMTQSNLPEDLLTSRQPSKLSSQSILQNSGRIPTTGSSLNVEKTRSNAQKGVKSHTRHYDILINSYQRSGSSFTGQLLAYHPDTFYWYEPIWHFYGLYYLMGRYVCIGNTTCGDFGNSYIDSAHRLLNGIYSCNFRRHANAVSENMTAQFSGAVWEPYLSCQAHAQPKKVCVKTMETICKQSKHRATKVVRLTVDNLEYILKRKPNVKAIHLFRDPRAIINSKLTTKWYKINDTVKNDHQLISLKARELCTRIKYDLKKGEKLKQKFPERFAFIMFEDLLDDLKSKTEMLYSYFGIDKTVDMTKVANIPDILQDDHTVKRTRGNYTNWWRFQLDFNAVKVIDQECGEILSFLGYKRFSNEVEMKDFSHKAYDLRKDMLMTNLNQKGSYNFSTLHQHKPYVRTIDIISKDQTYIMKQVTMLV